MTDLKDKKILLVISGGIAAYKALEIIRLIRKAGGTVQCILTKGGEQFVTPLSISALSENPVYTDLFSLKDETEMGHLRLSRESDLVIVAPASADIIAKMACGISDNLALATLLASNKPIFIAPAMNPVMWENPVTQDNIAKLQARGIMQIAPCSGAMACGETGTGRMAEPEDILEIILEQFHTYKPLSGYKALVTSGPTYEPLDPVRFIGNRSSGKQGHAIATALAAFGAKVTLITGPVSLPDPAGAETIRIETAHEMMSACLAVRSPDIVVCAAAVSDWAADIFSSGKIKKDRKQKPPSIALKENPDILATLAAPSPHRPQLVIGFAAETENLLETATRKRLEKKCDWILANDVGTEKIFGADENHVYLITGKDTEDWGKQSKHLIAQKLAENITAYFKSTDIQIAAE